MLDTAGGVSAIGIGESDALSLVQPTDLNIGEEVPTRVWCKFPGCGKSYASNDGVRKHAKRYHAQWLQQMDANRLPVSDTTPPGDESPGTEPSGSSGAPSAAAVAPAAAGPAPSAPSLTGHKRGRSAAALPSATAGLLGENGAPPPVGARLTRGIARGTPTQPDPALAAALAAGAPVPAVNSGGGMPPPMGAGGLPPPLAAAAAAAAAARAKPPMPMPPSCMPMGPTLMHASGMPVPMSMPAAAAAAAAANAAASAANSVRAALKADGGMPTSAAPSAIFKDARAVAQINRAPSLVNAIEDEFQERIDDPGNASRAQPVSSRAACAAAAAVAAGAPPTVAALAGAAATAALHGASPASMSEIPAAMLAAAQGRPVCDMIADATAGAMAGAMTGMARPDAMASAVGVHAHMQVNAAVANAAASANARSMPLSSGAIEQPPSVEDRFSDPVSLAPAAPDALPPPPRPVATAPTAAEMAPTVAPPATMAGGAVPPLSMTQSEANMFLEVLDHAEPSATAGPARQDSLIATSAAMAGRMPSLASGSLDDMLMEAFSEREGRASKLGSGGGELGSQGSMPTQSSQPLLPTSLPIPSGGELRDGVM